MEFWATFTAVIYVLGAYNYYTGIVSLFYLSTGSTDDLDGTRLVFGTILWPLEVLVGFIAVHFFSSGKSDDE
tara:strand:- start:2021 stop:2236 length:216 start_codon:yes stop_codon:yes gene_type:complete